MDNKEAEIDRAKKMKDNVIQLIFYGSFLACFIGYKCYKHFCLRNYGIITRGFVSNEPKSGKGTKAVYRFAVNGIEFLGTVSTQSNLMCHDGDSITVIYDPDDPENTRPACDVLDKYKEIK